MRLLKITCFLMLCGCETSLLGEWNGTCIFADANQESLVEVTNTVERDNGYLLEGTMELYTWEEDSFSGEMIGDHNGKYDCGFTQKTVLRFF